MNTYTSTASSTDDVMGPIISTVPESHIDLPTRKLHDPEVNRPTMKINLTQLYIERYALAEKLSIVIRRFWTLN